MSPKPYGDHHGNPLIIIRYTFSLPDKPFVRSFGFFSIFTRAIIQEIFVRNQCEALA
uniref:Uncharacterized protein n=1 Tax=Helianthus annuus TaxID=4232 RepID=A0A251STL0_HELAN